MIKIPTATIIRDFLAHYPKLQWAKCIEYSLIIGITSLSSQLSQSLSLDQLKSLSNGPPIPLALQTHRNHSQLKTCRRSSSLASNQLQQNKESPRTQQEGNKQLKNKVTVKNKHKCRKTLNKKPQITRKIPKYLCNVNSKIRENVKKDMKSYRKSYTKEYSPAGPRNFAFKEKEPPFRFCERAMEPSQVLVLAEEFLNNPLITQLSRSAREVTDTRPTAKFRELDRYKKIELDLSNTISVRSYSPLSLPSSRT